MVVILVFQNNEMAAMLLYQTNPEEVQIFSYVTLVLFHKICLAAGNVSEYALSTKLVR